MSMSICGECTGLERKLSEGKWPEGKRPMGAELQVSKFSGYDL